MGQPPTPAAATPAAASPAAAANNNNNIPPADAFAQATMRAMLRKYGAHAVATQRACDLLVSLEAGKVGAAQAPR